MNEATARDRLLDAGNRLFYANGVSATGINAITTAAGVAKMSLYNNFSSKDELVSGYIQSRHDSLLRSYEAHLEDAQDALGRVMAMFEAYFDHATLDHGAGFRGCGLLNIAGELPAGDPLRAVIAEHKAEVEQLLREELTAAGADDPERTSLHLSLLLEGAISRAGLEGTTLMLTQVRELARSVIVQREDESG